jgi:NAD(P)H-hydrate epimerase
VHVIDIGLDLGETATRLATVELLRLVPRRSDGDNKYTAGHVLVVGGSRGFTGAPCLSSLAAMRADAGYVTVAAPESTLPVFEQRLLEAVKRPLPDEAGLVAEGSADVVLDLAAKASALALGPGLGRGQGPQELVRRLLAEVELPVVVDADALFGLEPAEWAGPRVLTPHEGELARLLGRTSKEIAAHRIASVREASERFGCVVVLKGSDTLVAAPDRGLIVCAVGLPSLATAGTGDVLTGIAAAFLAKGMDPQLAAAAATVAQQRASVEAPQRAGLIASDLIEALPRVLA